jgi:hypothetical protein
MRIALGGITHKANTFCPHVTDMADFEARQLLRGDEILDNWQSTRTEQAGALSVLTEVPQCEVIPARLAWALSGAPMRQETFHSLSSELLDRVQAACPVDGVLLVLHGAMMAENEPEASGAILERLRAAVGPDMPIVGALDLHANVTSAWCRRLRRSSATTPRRLRRHPGRGDRCRRAGGSKPQPRLAALAASAPAHLTLGPGRHLAVEEEAPMPVSESLPLDKQRLQQFTPSGSPLGVVALV